MDDNDIHWQATMMLILQFYDRSAELKKAYLQVPTAEGAGLQPTEQAACEVDINIYKDLLAIPERWQRRPAADAAR
jgi:hypothetical protein